MESTHDRAAQSAYYVTTALPYVNGPPHIGYAFELVVADALARFRRLQGKDVRFSTGTDDNSLKNVRSAELCGVPTRVLVEQNAAKFRALRGALDLTFDDFIETSRDARHAPAVQELWRRCAAAGDLYRRSYRGLYCVGCEQFYAPEELVDGACPEHLCPPELVEEENYFFRLSRHAPALFDLISSDTLKIRPEAHRRETLKLIDRGLHDFSVSRTRKRARDWGIAVPGDPEQVIFVWFDALTNYISSLDFATGGGSYRRYWSECPERVHVIGKGIVRFHAVYWPALLLSAGLPLPSELLVHGYLTADGKKVGKSLGNAIDPFALAADYGSDAVRYYLLRHLHTTQDSDFSSSRLVLAHDAELAHQLGNLVRRTLTLVERSLGGAVPRAPESVAHALAHKATETAKDVERGFDDFALHESVAAVLRLVAAGNRYLDQTAPWALAKKSESGDARAERELGAVAYNALELLRVVAQLATPFVPKSAAIVRGALGLSLEAEPWTVGIQWGRLPAGAPVRSGPVLFPRLGGRRPR